MANKKPIKLSEAKILVFLENAHQSLHFVRKISSKLSMDYGYTIKILIDMYEKEWLFRDKSAANPTRTFYHLTKTGIEKLDLAKKIAAELVED